MRIIKTIFSASRFTSKDVCFLLFVCCTFYTINAVSPIRCDDLIYQYFWLEERIKDYGEPIDLYNRIDNYAEALHSQINHYFVMNGRFLAHYIVQCFCGFLGKPLFNIINSFIFFLFTLGCIKLLCSNTQEKNIFIIASLWLGLPILHIFYYSISFAVNYLWASTALIGLFIIIYKYKEPLQKKKTMHQLLFVFLCSLLLSSFHEGFSIPLCGILFLYILRKRKSTPIEIYVIMFGVLIGTLTTTLAPGIIGRGSGAMNSFSPDDFISKNLDVIRYSKRFIIFIISLAFFFILDKGFTISYLKKRSIIVGYIIIDFCFVLAIPHYSQRISFPYELLSLLLTLELIIEYHIWSRIKKYVCILMVATTLIQAPFVMYYAKITSVEYREMIAEYQQSSEGITHYKKISIPKPIRPYIKRLDKDVEREYISFTYGKTMVIEE